MIIKVYCIVAVCSKRHYFLVCKVKINQSEKIDFCKVQLQKVYKKQVYKKKRKYYDSNLFETKQLKSYRKKRTKNAKNIKKIYH